MLFRSASKHVRAKGDVGTRSDADAGCRAVTDPDVHGRSPAPGGHRADGKEGGGRGLMILRATHAEPTTRVPPTRRGVLDDGRPGG